MCMCGVYGFIPDTVWASLRAGCTLVHRIHQPCAEGRTPSAVDLVQVTDGTTGEMAFFRFPCEGSSRCGDQFVAQILKSILC